MGRTRGELEHTYYGRFEHLKKHLGRTGACKQKKCSFLTAFCTNFHAVTPAVDQYRIGGMNMKDTEKYYREIKKQFPKTMNKDQLYKVAHISKATALYLLRSGVLPCEDSGKKTRRYTIRTDDVIDYLRQRQIHPEKYKASEGWYVGIVAGEESENPSIGCQITLTTKQTKLFEVFFESKMKKMADLLTTEELSSFTGYQPTTVVNWCSTKRLKAFKIGRKYLIPKECAIKYLASPAMCHNPRQSHKYKMLVTEFKRQHKRSL